MQVAKDTDGTPAAPEWLNTQIKRFEWNTQKRQILALKVVVYHLLLSPFVEDLQIFFLHATEQIAKPLFQSLQTQQSAKIPKFVM